MKITVFTVNQPRHIALVELLTGTAEEVYVVQECRSLFPGEYSAIMEQYFVRVRAAEKAVFGTPRFMPTNVTQLSLAKGDLDKLDLDILQPALHSDIYIVSGAGYAKGPICDFLIAHNAYDIHMGVSPYYCGGASNFWAMYDRRPDYVGATIQLHAEEIDTGPILFHVFPQSEAMEPFLLGMKAAYNAQKALIYVLNSGELQKIKPVQQDSKLRLRHATNDDFTEEVALEYLNRLPTPAEIKKAMALRDMSKFIRPIII